MSKENTNDTTTAGDKALTASTGSLSTWYKRYRIVHDNYLGYEAQVWRIWWPMWTQLYFTNTSSTQDRAIAICRRHKNPL